MAPIISLIVPSRNRTHGLKRSIDMLLRTTQGYDVEILAVLDRPDTNSIQMVQRDYPMVKIVLMPESYVNGHPQQKWQEGYKASSGEWIAQITDDIVMVDGWLTACLNTPSKGIIGFADPNWCGMLMTLLMATREYIETVMHGRFGLPWYHVEWADNEWTARAREADAAVWCHEAKFEHFRDHDSQRELVLGKPEIDAHTYLQRHHAGWPEDWPEAV